MRLPQMTSLSTILLTQERITYKTTHRRSPEACTTTSLKALVHTTPLAQPPMKVAKGRLLQEWSHLLASCKRNTLLSMAVVEH